MRRILWLALNGLVAAPVSFSITFILWAAAMLAGCAGGGGMPGAAATATSPASIAGIVDADAPRQSSTADATSQGVEIGRSREGRPILLFRFGSGERPVLILGGIHGSEGNSAVCAQLLVSYLHAHPGDAVAPLVVIPEANPDGLERRVRYNARRVDLNRNFPAANWAKSYASGGKPASEPETVAIGQVIKDLRPRRILSIHSIAGEPCNNFDGPADPLARAMASANGYGVKEQIGYPTPGSLGSWAGSDLGIPVVTLELPASTTGADAWKRNRSAILAFLVGP